jgi:hypothetical protein
MVFELSFKAGFTLLHWQENFFAGGLNYYSLPLAQRNQQKVTEEVLKNYRTERGLRVLTHLF